MLFFCFARGDLTAVPFSCKLIIQMRFAPHAVMSHRKGKKVGQYGSAVIKPRSWNNLEPCRLSGSQMNFSSGFFFFPLFLPVTSLIPHNSGRMKAREATDLCKSSLHLKSACRKKRGGKIKNPWRHKKSTEIVAPQLLRINLDLTFFGWGVYCADQSRCESELCCRETFRAH